jgi:hypothetical protein
MLRNFYSGKSSPKLCYFFNLKTAHSKQSPNRLKFALSGHPVYDLPCQRRSTAWRRPSRSWTRTTTCWGPRRLPARSRSNFDCLIMERLLPSLFYYIHMYIGLYVHTYRHRRVVTYGCTYFCWVKLNHRMHSSNLSHFLKLFTSVYFIFCWYVCLYVGMLLHMYVFVSLLSCTYFLYVCLTTYICITG